MISRKHRVIFVRIPKTAGQSIGQTFLDDLGLGWDQRGALLLRPNADPAKGPTALAHLYADEHVRLGHVGQAEFDSYYKFAAVRNPYGRLLSESRCRTRSGRPARSGGSCAAAGAGTFPMRRGTWCRRPGIFMMLKENVL